MDMQSLLKQLPFTQQMQFHESNVRGTYISIACDYSRLMDDLIALCEINKIFPAGIDTETTENLVEGIKSYKIRKITGIEMGKKERRCREGLKAYNEEHYDRFKPQFKIMQSLIADRNLMTHGYSDYYKVPTETDKIFIHFENTEKGIYEEKIIEVYPFIRNLISYRDSIMELMGLTLTIRNELFGKRLIV